MIRTWAEAAVGSRHAMWPGKIYSRVFDAVLNPKTSLPVGDHHLQFEICDARYLPRRQGAAAVHSVTAWWLA